MKIKEIRELSKEELVQKEKALKKELLDLNFQKRYGRVEKPGRFRTVRREIARILTILKQKEIEGKDGSNRSKSK